LGELKEVSFLYQVVEYSDYLIIYGCFQLITEVFEGINKFLGGSPNFLEDLLSLYSGFSHRSFIY
jgi:hypothetical protein